MSATYQSQANAAMSGSTSVATTLPAGVTLGDLLMLEVYSLNQFISGTPSGWTQQETSTGTAFVAYLFVKVAGASEVAPTLAWPANVNGTWKMSRYNANDQATPIHKSSSIARNATANPAQVSFTTTVAGCTIVGLYSETGGSVTYTAESTPIVATQQSQQATDSQGDTLFHQDYVQPAAGAIALTVTSASSNYAVFQVAILPATAARIPDIGMGLRVT